MGTHPGSLGYFLAFGMIIPLTDKLRIKSDVHSWDLQKPEKTKKGPVWKGIRYYTSLPSALKGAFQYELRVTPTEDGRGLLRELKGKYGTLREEYEDAL